jgi:hypothetical protein
VEVRMTIKYLVQQMPVVFTVMSDLENKVIEGFTWRVVDAITGQPVSDPYSSEERAIQAMDRLNAKA